MKKNMSLIDRVFRVVFAIVATLLYFLNITSGVVGITLMAVGGILLATSFINFCPIYAALGISTIIKKVKS